MPLGDGGIAPVKLLSSKWIKDRAAKLKAATTDEERRKLRLPAGRTSNGTSRRRL